MSKIATGILAKKAPTCRCGSNKRALYGVQDAARIPLLANTAKLFICSVCRPQHQLKHPEWVIINLNRQLCKCGSGRRPRYKHRELIPGTRSGFVFCTAYVPRVEPPSHAPMVPTLSAEPSNVTNRQVPVKLESNNRPVTKGTLVADPGYHPKGNVQFQDEDQESYDINPTKRSRLYRKWRKKL
jgi:hypothetical protein